MGYILFGPGQPGLRFEQQSRPLSFEVFVAPSDGGAQRPLAAANPCSATCTDRGGAAHRRMVTTKKRGTLPLDGGPCARVLRAETPSCPLVFTETWSVHLPALVSP